MAEDKNLSSSYSEPKYATSGRQISQYPWWNENIDKYLTPEVQNFLLRYSGIALKEQSKHVHEIRERAWAIRTYPCTGQGVWLRPYISRSPALADIVSVLQNGGSFFDVGCHLGGDLRWLAYQGAPTDRMYGIDIASHEVLSYELFRDKDKFKACFIEADFLDASNAEMHGLLGTVDVLSVSAVLHQWGWNDQVKAAKRLVEFVNGVGSLVVGHQIGNAKGGEIEFPPGSKIIQWRHDAQSWKKLWDDVGAETGTKWAVSHVRMLTWAELEWDPNDLKFLPAGDLVIDWVVKRIE